MVINNKVIIIDSHYVRASESVPMENILNKNIFSDKVLNKLSPDYRPHDVVLRMQLRRTLVKDTHNHGVFRSTTWTRKSIMKTKENNFKINREIVKLRHDFNNINLKNRVTLKALDTLKAKSEIFDNELLLNEDFDLQEYEKDIIYLPEFSKSNKLEIKNEKGFRLNSKIKPVKRNKVCRETRMGNGSESHNAELLDLNKDINENNEDIFKVSCINKRLKPEVENEPNEQSNNNDKSNITVDDIDKSVGDLQKLLVMMTISSKPSKDEEPIEKVGDSHIESSKNETYHNNINSGNITTNTTAQCESIDDILNIIPLRVQIKDKEKYLMEKYIAKWRNYINNKKKHIEERREATLNNFFEKIAKKKTDVNQASEAENKIKQHLKDYNTYQHRYKVQKHIIALQKAKLEEQSRLIEELKYNKIVEGSRQSVDAMREEVRRTYYDIDRQLKPKMKSLTKELKITDIEEPALVLHCLKVPQFLQRMEKRAREREEKHAMIRERRRQMEEERVRIKQQAELAKAEMDKEEKMRRITELKEKRKKERIETIRKKQWCERLRALIVMADLHYEKTLMIKYGIAPLRKLVKIKRDNIEKARAHYRFQLKHNVFLQWMWYTEDLWFERNFKAEDFYRKTLMRKVFKGFRMIHYNVILKKQVADDYYDLYVTQLGFRMFCEGIKVIRREEELKWQKAIKYHSSNLLFKAFTCWRTLPALNALKREQEARKARWREKVLQVVPDYTPPVD